MLSHDPLAVHPSKKRRIGTCLSAAHVISTDVSSGHISPTDQAALLVQLLRRKQSSNLFEGLIFGLQNFREITQVDSGQFVRNIHAKRSDSQYDLNLLPHELLLHHVLSAPHSQVAIVAIFLRRGQIAGKFLRKSVIFARNSQTAIAIGSDGNPHLEIALLPGLRMRRKSQRFPACGGTAQSQSQKSRDFGALRPCDNPRILARKFTITLLQFTMTLQITLTLVIFSN